jgi:hypothetical protein
MAMAGKVYVVEDADPEASSGIPAGTFPGTLAGLLDALDAARYRSAAGTPKVLIIAEGKDRQVIRRFENGQETSDGVCLSPVAAGRSAARVRGGRPRSGETQGRWPLAWLGFRASVEGGMWPFVSLTSSWS